MGYSLSKHTETEGDISYEKNLYEYNTQMENKSNETSIHIKEPSSELLDKLEEDGYKKLATLGETLPQNASPEYVCDALINIMHSGNEEFKKTIGRPMTYAEMRQAYG